MNDCDGMVWDLGDVLDFAHLAKSQGLHLSTGPGDVFLSVYRVGEDHSWHLRFWHDGRVDAVLGKVSTGRRGGRWMTPEPREWRAFFGLDALEADHA